MEEIFLFSSLSKAAQTVVAACNSICDAIINSLGTASMPAGSCPRKQHQERSTWKIRDPMNYRTSQIFAGVEIGGPKQVPEWVQNQSPFCLFCAKHNTTSESNWCVSHHEKCTAFFETAYRY